MITGTNTPMVLAWGTNRPLRSRPTTSNRNLGPTPGPTPWPTPGPETEPGDASIMLSGSRNANQPKRVVLTGTTVNIAQGSEIQPYWRLNKRGKQWRGTCRRDSRRRYGRCREFPDRNQEEQRSTQLLGLRDHRGCDFESHRHPQGAVIAHPAKITN